MEDKGKIYYCTGLDNSRLRDGAQEAKNILHGIGNAANEEGERLDETFSKLGKTVAGVFSAVMLKDFVKNVATVRGEFQQLEMGFKTMLGSEEKADALMSQLIKTAATTPFGMSDIAQASKQLLAYGVQAEDVNETLIRLGDIAAGLSIPIGDLAYLYGTTMVQGRLFTQDLRQFTGRGIPLTEELAKQFGVTKDKVGELVTAGKVGFPEVKKAIESLTSEGSKFGGLMEAQSKTITGQISNIEDSIEQMFNELGKKSEGVISDTLAVVSSLVENWESVGKTLLVVISAYGAYKAAVIAVAAAHKIAAIWGEVQAFLSLTKAITSAKDAMLLLNIATKANPIGLILGVVAAAASAFVLFRDKTDAAADAIARERQEAQEFESKVGAAAASMMTQYKALQTEYKKCKTAHEKTEWIKNNRDKFKELSISVGNVNTAENLFVKNTDAMMTAFKKRAEAAAWQSKLEDAYAKRVERQLQLEEQQRKITAGSEVHTMNHDARTGNEYVDNSGKWVYTEQGAAKARKALMQNDAILSNLDAKIEQYAKKVQSVENEYTAALKTAGSNPTVELTDKEKQAAKKAAEEKQKAADAAAERADKISERTKARSIEEREAELEIRQAAIDGMKEGYDKQIKENELEYDRLILSNDKRREQMLAQLKDDKALEWRQANPKATKEEEIQYRATITEADLSDTQRALLEATAKAAKDMQVKKNKEALDEMLTDIRDYYQQREAIEKDYNIRRAALYVDGDESKGLKEGVTEGNLSELQHQRDEALNSVDEEFASREESYQAWCDEIANLSLKQLEEVLARAQEELKALESAGDKNSQKIATARAKVSKAQAAVNKSSAQNSTAPGKRTIKEWEDLYSTLNECNNSFKEIGDTVGGVAGDIIKTVGGITGSTLQMVNGIVTLVTSSSATMVGTAAAGATAISTMEKASVILTVISAAMSIAMDIVNLFNSDQAKQEHIEALQGQIDQLQWEVDNANLVRLQQEYGKATDSVAQAYSRYRNELAAAAMQLYQQGGMYAYLTQIQTTKTQVMQKNAENIAKAYANVGYAADKALGADKYKSAQDTLKNYAQQQLLIQEQIETERSKKKSDSDAIKAYEQKIEEIGGKAVELINDLVEDIIGGGATDIAKELSDAFFDAFQDGEDYAEAWGDKVNDIVADVIKRMLVSQYLEAPLGEIFDKYKAKWFKDGNFAGTQAIIDSMAGFAADLNAVGDDFRVIWDNLPDSVKDMFTVTADASREASQEGIATASQESVDELNGRMTAVQGHTYSISENTKLLVANTAAILQSVLNIEANTDRLAAVETNIREVRITLNDLALKGIKIK